MTDKTQTTPTDEEFVLWLEAEVDFDGTEENERMYDALRRRLGAAYV